MKSYLSGIVLLSVSTVTIVTAYSGNAPDVDDKLRSQLLPESLREGSTNDGDLVRPAIAQVPDVGEPVPTSSLEATDPSNSRRLAEPRPPKSQPKENSDRSQSLGPESVPNFREPSQRGRVATFNSWFQASTEGLKVPEITRTHAYFMDDQKVFRGKVSMLGTNQAVPSAITFSQMGKVIRKVPLSQNGEFIAQSLPPGPYGLHIKYQNTLLMYGFYLATTNDLRESGYTEEKIQEVLYTQRRSPIWLNSFTSNPADYQVMTSLVGDHRFDELEASQLVSTRNMLDVPPNLNFKASAQGTSIHDHIVRLHDDGTLYGRTRRLATMPNNKTGIVPAFRAEISFIKNGRIVSRTVSDASGNFRARGLTEGKYTLVVKHPEGIAVLGLTAKELPPVTAKKEIKAPAFDISDGLPPVNFQDNSGQEPDTEEAQFIPGPDGTELMLDVTLFPTAQPLASAAVGAAGGIGGGGAAAGGGGLLGSLLLGGLGGPPLLDDDNDGNPTNPDDPNATPDTP